MLQDQNLPSSGKLKSKETISQLAHRHMRDPKHTTTDEELANAQLELSGAADISEETTYDSKNPTQLPSF